MTGQKKNNPKDQSDVNARSQALGRRLQSFKERYQTDEKRAGAPGGPRAGSGFVHGLRLGGELVSGILVGAGLGFFVDKLLDTSPFGFIVFFLLGFVAGILNLLRAVGAIALPGKNKDENS